MDRVVTILGSTGSIGRSTVDILRQSPTPYRVEALVAGSRVEILAEQARSLRPRLAVVADETALPALKDALAGTGIEAAAGESAVLEAASRPADWVMAAIVGAAGLEPTLRAIRQGTTVALANKECLVCAGALMMTEVAQHGATLLPVDSEHSAIFQVYDFNQLPQVEKIILTASGGPFRTWSREAMAKVTPQQALAHPNWSMGAKISIDSATMVNKGLELVEAHHLFRLPEDQIEVVIHPQSVVHSLVAYRDGSVLAQMGCPDMRTPIAFAYGWPQRMVTDVPRLDLAQMGKLTFDAPDPERFPALALVRQALRQGGCQPTLFSAANEVAVDAFLTRRIGFLDIVRVIEGVLDRVRCPVPASVADVLAVDRLGRQAANALIETMDSP